MIKKRIGYVDQFRGLATVFMIETHVVNALLSDSLKGTMIFSLLNFVNGLVAPSFLFVAGFSFTLAVNRKGDAYRRFSPELRKHMKRLLFILAVGYALHLPFFSLRKIIYGSTPADITAFFAVDILQCIAVTLILIHLIRVIINSDRTFNLILWGLFWFFIIGAPFAGYFDPGAVLPKFLGQYFNSVHGSLFPLFPWAGFLIAGAIFSQKVTFEKESKFAANLVRIGGGMVVVGLLLLEVQRFLLPQTNVWDYAPGWFLLRLGMLIWILKAIIWYEGKRETVWSSVKIFGRESFLVYVVHILLVYGSSAKNPSLVESLGTQLNYFQCTLIFVLLAAVMFAAAYSWSELKSRNYQLSRLVQWIAVTGFFYLFIKNPY